MDVKTNLGRIWFLPSLALSLVLTLITYGIMFGADAAVEGGTLRYVVDLFLKRGAIPYFLTFGFYLGIALLLIRFPLLFSESRELTTQRDALGRIDVIGEQELTTLQSSLSNAKSTVHMHRGTERVQRDAGQPGHHVPGRELHLAQCSLLLGE